MSPGRGHLQGTCVIDGSVDEVVAVRRWPGSRTVCAGCAVPTWRGCHSAGPTQQDRLSILHSYLAYIQTRSSGDVKSRVATLSPPPGRAAAAAAPEAHGASPEADGACSSKCAWRACGGHWTALFPTSPHPTITHHIKWPVLALRGLKHGFHQRQRFGRRPADRVS